MHLYSLAHSNMTRAMAIHHHGASHAGIAKSALHYLCSIIVFFHASAVFCAPVNSTSESTSLNPLQLHTSIGVLAAVDVGSNIARTTVPYAVPPLGDLRFANPQPVSSVGSYDTTKTPPACYQGTGDPRGGNPPSEDCLYATYYYPKDGTSSPSKPVLVWVHGGSGIGGSSTAAGLDGTPWASSQDVVIVLLQYRLGLFGWLQTSQTLDEGNGGGKGAANVAGNQAMRDVVQALQQLRNIVGTMGGDPNKVTLMGQSSGASMVRALISTPAAESLFNNAILVSDPQDYGPSSIADNNALGEYGMQQLNCSISDLACARAANVDDVLDATYAAYSDVPAMNDRISSGTPWRSMIGKYIPSTMSRDPESAKSKTIIMSTVSNEAGTAVGYLFAPSAPNATTLTYNAGGTTTPGDAADIFFNNGRGNVAANETSVYPATSTKVDGLREIFETLSTDGLWRCGTQRNAINVANAGGKTYLAQWRNAAKYPSNAAVQYCTSDNHICHEDDIYVIFGTTPGGQVNAALTAITSEMQTRYANFARTGTPSGPSGTVTWSPLKGRNNLNMLVIGKPGGVTADGGKTSIALTQHPSACNNLWGTKVLFDSQAYPA